MKRVLAREDLEGRGKGERVHVPPDTIVTPMARDYAAKHGIELVVGAPEPGAATGGAASGDALVEAVTGEVMRTIASLQQGPSTPTRSPLVGLTPLGAPEASSAARHLAQCVACPNNEPDPALGNRGIITATGQNHPGIVARLATEVADAGADILEISQTIVSGFFTIIMIVDARGLERESMTFAAFRDRIAAAAKEIGCEAQVMHERVLQSMHRI